MRHALATGAALLLVAGIVAVLVHAAPPPAAPLETPEVRRVAAEGTAGTAGARQPPTAPEPAAAPIPEEPLGPIDEVVLLYRTWKVNCDGGPLQRVPEARRRIEHRLADTSLPDEERARLERDYDIVRELESRLLVRLCVAVYPP